MEHRPDLSTCNKGRQLQRCTSGVALTCYVHGDESGRRWKEKRAITEVTARLTNVFQNLIPPLTSSRGGTRTPDRVINSHLLYHLSYPGILGATTSTSPTISST